MSPVAPTLPPDVTSAPKNGAAQRSAAVGNRAARLEELQLGRAYVDGRINWTTALFLAAFTSARSLRSSISAGAV